MSVVAQLWTSGHLALHGLVATSGEESITLGTTAKIPGEIKKAMVSEYINDILLVDEFAIEGRLDHFRIGSSNRRGAGAAPLCSQYNRFDLLKRQF